MSYEAFGTMIKVARQAAGLDQPTLAGMIGVGQQAVSTWERGGSRPREGMLPLLAEILGLETHVLQTVGRYEPIHTAASGQPRLRTLPFEQLTDDAFEGFVRDLLHGLHPSWKVSRNGSQGHKQFGVDVFAIDDEENQRIGVQCKRQRSFGPSDVRKAVEAVTEEADVTRGLIALSRTTATPQARNELHRHRAWELWDGEDLAARVRDLPRDKQLALIDLYFPRSREDFLGILEPSPWLNISEQHNGLAGKAGYDSTFPLLGRDAELSRLRDLAADANDMIFVVGNGGIGKSRLLAEYALSEQDRDVRFAPRGMVHPAMFDLLPEGAPVVILDDLLEPDATLLDTIAGVRRARPDATVVLSLRPRVVEEWHTRLGIASTTADAFTVHVEDLSITDAEKLARFALGENEAEDRVVELLARSGYDCPLVIVLGAHLYREGNMTGIDLASGHGLRTEVLKAFADSLTSDSVGRDLRDVLATIAAVQPVRLEQPEFIAALEQLAPDAHSALKSIDQLEDRGLVLRRGQVVRVVPDLLGEAVLEDALVSRSGPTRFAAKLASNLTGVALAQALRNVSTIDWYRRARGESQLASELWGSLIEHALTLGNGDRIRLIDAVEPVAAVHAEQALRFAQSLIENPAPDEEDEFSKLFGGNGLRTTTHVKLKLPKLLRNASHDPNVMAECLRMLLDLGRDDTRQENSNPEHAWRLLRELGEYNPDRSIAFNERYIDVVDAWLHDETLSALRPDLLRFLAPLLASEVTVTRWKGLSLELAHIPIDRGNVEQLRARVIGLAREFSSGTPAIGCAAVALLEQALRNMGDTETIGTETALVFDLLESLLADATTHASVRVSAYRALSWHATYGAGAHQTRAREARRSVVLDSDYLVVRSLRAGIGSLEDVDDAEDALDSDAESTASRATNRYQRLDQSVARSMTSVAEEWAGIYSASQAAEHLLDLIRIERLVADHISPPNALVASLTTRIPDFAASLLDLQQRDDPAIWMTQRAALATLLTMDEPTALIKARSLIDNAHSALLVAEAAVATRSESHTERVLDLLEELIDIGDPAVSRTLLRGWRWWRPLPVDLLTHVIRVAPIDKDSALAEAVAELLTDPNSLTWEMLSSADRQIVLRKLTQTPRLDGYAHGLLLSRVLEDDPARVLSFLMDRIENANTEGYEALPYTLDSTLNFSSTAAYPVLLRQTVEWVLDGRRLRKHYFEVKSLLEMLAKPVGEAVLALVLELFRTGQKDRLSVATMLLEDASRHFAIDQRQFVSDAVAIATSLPEESRRNLLHALHAPSLYGMRSRSVGVDDPEEIALRDAARSIAAELPTGTALRQFYEDVASMADQRISAERAGDAEMLQVRQW